MTIINETGIREIHAFLAENHKLGGDHFTESMLRAWAEEAEFQLAEGNTPTIEIKSWDAISGHTETYTISAEGVDDDRAAQLAKTLVEEADESGSSRNLGGVWLWTAETLKEDQKTWHENDASKGLDTSAYPYWLVTDDGVTPRGITGSDDNDLLDLCEQYA